MPRASRVRSEPSRRSQPLPPDWRRTRARILRRDDHRCTTCGARATDVDHIVPAFRGGIEHDENLRALCRPCHKTKTANEANPPRRRTPERHPGIVA